jgi:acyl-CoA ligase (AMP-forming) (exosortase A-associated)
MHTQLHHLVKSQAAITPLSPALTYRDQTLSYGELWQEIKQTAVGLVRLGLCPNDRVGIFMEKRFEAIATIFAASYAGGVFVPINPLLRGKQVAYIIENCAITTLVTTAERFEGLRADLSTCASLKSVVLVGAGLQPIASEGFAVKTWTEFTHEACTAVPAEHRAVDFDMAAIFYTSGSTGKPKGVVLSHRNLIVGGESVSSYLKNCPADIILAALPISFDAGFSQLTTAFASGAQVVLANYVLPEDIVRLCARHRITGLTGVPPLWIQLIEKNWPLEATDHLRYFANTGGRMPKATLDRLRSIFPKAKPFLMYGLTEAFRSTYLDPAEVDRRPDSIGKAIPNAEILVVRPDGTICEAGEEGELVHRGALVSLGYWGDPERTAERFKPAPARQPGLCIPEMSVWSGDVVVRDNEGFLYFRGRRDEMIKTSGYRVSPAEVEEVVYGTGLVRDAVALGLDHEKLGQCIVLLVSPLQGKTIDATVLLAEMKKQLPNYMLPERIIVRSELPRSPNGKFDRNLLKQEIAV